VVDRFINITLTTFGGAVYPCTVWDSDSISKVFDRYTDLCGTPTDMFRAVFNGRELEKDGMTVHEAGLTEGSRVCIIVRLRGGKPVIYLYPPTPKDVSVKLSLIPTWEYSAVYPLTVIKEVELAKGQVGQYIEWNVRANPSGLLQDKVSGRDITYLFWEAECAASLTLLFLY